MSTSSAASVLANCGLDLSELGDGRLSLDEDGEAMTEGKWISTLTDVKTRRGRWGRQHGEQM